MDRYWIILIITLIFNLTVYSQSDAVRIFRTVKADTGKIKNVESDSIALRVIRFPDGSKQYTAGGGSGGGDFASRSLDNLISTQINTSLIPIDTMRNLGSLSKYWRSIYLSNIWGLFFTNKDGKRLVLNATPLTNDYTIWLPDTSGIVVVNSSLPLIRDNKGKIKINFYVDTLSAMLSEDDTVTINTSPLPNYVLAEAYAYYSPDNETMHSGYAGIGNLYCRINGNNITVYSNYENDDYSLVKIIAYYKLE